MSLSELPTSILANKLLPYLHGTDLYNLAATNSTFADYVMLKYPWHYGKAQFDVQSDISHFNDFLIGRNTSCLTNLTFTFSTGNYFANLLTKQIPSVTEISIHLESMFPFDITKLMFDLYAMAPKARSFTLISKFGGATYQPNGPFNHFTSPWNLKQLQVLFGTTAAEFAGTAFWDSVLYSTTNLEQLSYFGTSPPNTGSFVQVHAPRIKKLHLHVDAIPISFLSKFVGLEQFEYCYEDGYFSVPRAQDILPNLKTFKLYCYQLDNCRFMGRWEGVENLEIAMTESFGNLEVIDKEATIVTLEHFPNLKHLKICYETPQGISDKDIENLAQLSKLESIRLRNVASVSGCVRSCSVKSFAVSGRSASMAATT